MSLANPGELGGTRLTRLPTAAGEPAPTLGQASSLDVVSVVTGADPRTDATLTRPPPSSTIPASTSRAKPNLSYLKHLL